MVDRDLFISPFVQSGNCCMIASCAIVIDYLSNQQNSLTITAESVFRAYIEYIIRQTSTNTNLKEINSTARHLLGEEINNQEAYEDSLQSLYYDYCNNIQPGGIRGSEHLKCFIEDYCSSHNLIVHAQAYTDYPDIFQLESALELPSTSLAVVLFPVSDKEQHWVTVGKNDCHIYRDTRCSSTSEFIQEYWGKSIDELGISEYVMIHA